MLSIFFHQNLKLNYVKFGNTLEEILFISLLFFVVAYFLWKVTPNLPVKITDYEKKIITTVSKNRIIDESFFHGLNTNDLKSAIRQEIQRLNSLHELKIDIDKMNVLMENLEFENLKKLYQWFFYKGSC